MSLKKLPIGISTFEVLRNDNCVYVDKTKIIYDLITQGYRYFLARPRRFGKSLLVSTFKEIFEGNRELFKGLWIYSSDYQWPKHPVIHLDMSGLSSKSGAELIKNIARYLASIADRHAITLPTDADLKSQFSELIRLLSIKSKVVILIDEYDYPILDALDQPEIAEECREILRHFYTMIKSNDAYIKFAFLTGVTKFTQTSIFSGLNNLNDLTMSEKGATLLGYTYDELTSNFMPHIERIAHQKKMSVQTVLDQMQHWYNGYQFSDLAEYDNIVVKVYNPYSILLFLDKGKFDNYWFKTGTPTFLLHLIEQKKFQPIELANITVSSDELEAFEIEKINLKTLLYQTGYLTIKNYDEDVRLYHLSFPNYEVTQSFLGYLLRMLTNATQSALHRTVRTIQQALDAQDVDLFFTTLQTLIAHIPSNAHVAYERYYQSIIFVVAKLANPEVVIEEQTNIGRSDMTIHTQDAIYLVEFKIHGSAQTALQQIEDKKYAQKYAQSGKKIILVGVVIDTAERNIKEWLVKE